MSAMRFNWIIHCCRNGVSCDECGEVENGFLENACNVHTHGMGQYGHMDFQLVLQYSDGEIFRILNTFGLWFRKAEFSRTAMQSAESLKIVMSS